MSVGLSGNPDPWNWGDDESNTNSNSVVPPHNNRPPDPTLDWSHPPHNSSHSYHSQYSKENVQHQTHDSRTQPPADYFESFDFNREQHQPQNQKPNHPPPSNQNNISNYFWEQSLSRPQQQQHHGTSQQQVVQHQQLIQPVQQQQLVQPLQPQQLVQPVQQQQLVQPVQPQQLVQPVQQQQLVQPVQQQQQGRYDKVNNSNVLTPPVPLTGGGVTEVENREIAPPDQNLPTQTISVGYGKAGIQGGYETEEQNCRESGGGAYQPQFQSKPHHLPSHFNPQTASSPVVAPPSTTQHQPPQQYSNTRRQANSSSQNQSQPAQQSHLEYPAHQEQAQYPPAPTHQLYPALYPPANQHQQPPPHHQQFPSQQHAPPPTDARLTPTPPNKLRASPGVQQPQPERPPSIPSQPSENFQVHYQDSSRPSISSSSSSGHYQNYQDNSQFQSAGQDLHSFSQYRSDSQSSNPVLMGASLDQYQQSYPRSQFPQNDSSSPPPPAVGSHYQSAPSYYAPTHPPPSAQFRQNLPPSNTQTPPPPVHHNSQAPLPQQQQYANSTESGQAITANRQQQSSRQYPPTNAPAQYPPHNHPPSNVKSVAPPLPAHQFTNPSDSIGVNQPSANSLETVEYQESGGGNRYTLPPPRAYPIEQIPPPGVHYPPSLGPPSHSSYPNQRPLFTDPPQPDNNLSSANSEAAPSLPPPRESSKSPSYLNNEPQNVQSLNNPPSQLLENQERIPENREHLDNTEVLQQHMSALSINHQQQQQVESEVQQEHCSVSDRNQYLETGQLSNLNNMAIGSANIEIADEGEAPPPGLHRLVTGQGCENQEQIVDTQTSSTYPIPHPHPQQTPVDFSSVPHINQHQHQHDTTRHSSSLSSIGEPEELGRQSRETDGERCGDERDDNWGGAVGGDLPTRLVPGGQSVPEQPSGSRGGGAGGDTRQVPGQARLPTRVVLGENQNQHQLTLPHTPPLQDTSSARSDTGREGRERDRDRDRERERDRDRDRDRNRESDSRIERMVEGEPRSKQSQNMTHNSTLPDDYNHDYRQPHRSRHRHRRESSYEEDERDYSTDREKRHEDFRRRDTERHRRRREHRSSRSPDYRSDEEYEERRGYSRRESRRAYDRDYSPDYSYRRHRRHGHGEHYMRDYDDYYSRENRSRPSSRTGSDYRITKSEYQRHSARHFYPEPNLGAGHYRELNAMNQRLWKDYYENMRRTDPKRYTEWYNRYMQQCSAQRSTSYSNDRASVHSGQSSTNQRHHNITLANETVERLEEQVNDDTLTNEDYSPRLYSTAHVRGNFDGLGRLIVVDAHYPIDGQRPTVKICKLNHLSVDPDIIEFLESPGPFIPGVTHRNTVLQYVKRMSDRATTSSEKLLYDFVHLVIKGNNRESDVAELLMESYKKSVQEDQDKNVETSTQQISETAIISRFRELLQQGNKMEALEWAIDNKAWGHALFLAYKMDSRTHNNVMLRFANSLPHNDPLQTLYQLMSGHVPQASTYCADKSWSDWRPHLAMILSNPTSNSNELDKKAIITLGDSLAGRGRVHAAQFCYLAAQVEFTSYKPNSKLVLLGSSANQEFNKFATCRSIMLSLCYEYALKLYTPDYSIPTFLFYKLLLAIRLFENERQECALQYCETIAKQMTAPSAAECFDETLAAKVIELATHLKSLDPVVAISGDTNTEPDWLTQLNNLYQQALTTTKHEDETDCLNHGLSNSTISEVDQLQYQANQDSLMRGLSTSYINTGSVGGMGYDMGQQNMYAGGSGVPLMMTTHLAQEPPEMVAPDTQHQHHTSIHQESQPYQHQQHHSTDFNGYHRGNSLGNEKPWENGNVTNLETSARHTEEQQSLLQPSILLDPTSSSVPPLIAQPSNKVGSSYYKALDEQLKSSEKREEATATTHKPPDTSNNIKSSSATQSSSKKTGQQQESGSGGGWFGGIWQKFTMRPKNQMRLPDDKNPTIVWDAEKKRWVNLDGEEDDKVEIKPPPKAAELAPTAPSTTQPGAHNLQTQTPPHNKYKLQKGRLKSRYVDVMAGGMTRSGGGGSTHEMDHSLLTNPPPPLNTNLFVPAPVEGSDNAAPMEFISAGGGNPVINSKQAVVSDDGDGDVPPMMYNPASFPT